MALSCQHLLTFPSQEELPPASASTKTQTLHTQPSIPTSSANAVPTTTPAGSSTAPAKSVGVSQVVAAAIAVPTCVTALVTAFTDGKTFAHAIIEAPLPSWNNDTPQCSLDERGRIDAVRCTCEVAQSGSVLSVSTPFAAAQQPQQQSTLQSGHAILLDMVEIPPWVTAEPTLAHSALASQLGNSRQLVLGDGGGCSSTGQRGTAVVYGLQGMAARSAAFDFDDDDEDEDEAGGSDSDREYVILGAPSNRSQQQLRLTAGGGDSSAAGGPVVTLPRRLQAPGGGLRLLGAGDLSPSNLWVAHSGGCWALSLPWLSTLSQRKAERAALEQQASQPSVGEAGDDSDLTEGLPSVVLREVDGVGASSERQAAAAGSNGGGERQLVMVSGSCVMRDAFLGDGALLLQPSGEFLEKLVATVFPGLRCPGCCKPVFILAT